MLFYKGKYTYTGARFVKQNIKSLIIILTVLLLHGCNEEWLDARDCAEQIIVDYEYITLDDGSVITGAPIYECVRYFDK